MDDHLAARLAPRIVPATIHTEVEAALGDLTLVLADPERSSVDIDLAAEVADVLSALIDTRPPMPPLNYPECGVEDQGQALALLHRAAGHLAIAALASRDVGEQLRAGVAVHELRDLIERWRP